MNGHELKGTDMRWKKKSNFIIACVLSLAYTIVTLLNIIGPLHINRLGTINTLGPLSAYSVIYWFLSLVITWGVYFYLRKKPETLFFTLIIMGIIIIIVENFLWGWMGP